MAKRKAARSKEGSWPPPMQASQENPMYMEPEWGPRLPIPGPGRPTFGPRQPNPNSPNHYPGQGAWEDGPGSGFDIHQGPYDNPTRPFFDDPWGPRIKDVGDFPFDPDRWVASHEAPASTRPKKGKPAKSKGSKKSKSAKARRSGSRGGKKGK